MKSGKDEIDMDNKKLHDEIDMDNNKKLQWP